MALTQKPSEISEVPDVDFPAPPMLFPKDAPLQKAFEQWAYQWQQTVLMREEKILKSTARAVPAT